jgi:hypothetical protein
VLFWASYLGNVCTGSVSERDTTVKSAGRLDSEITGARGTEITQSPLLSDQLLR